MATLFDCPLPDLWTWEPIQGRYRITKKPRHLKVEESEELPFVPMEAVPLGGQTELTYQLRSPSDITSGTYFEKGDVLLSKITPSFENGKQAMAWNIPQTFGYGSTELIPLQAAADTASNPFLFFYLLHPEVRALLAGKMEGSTGRQRVPEQAVRELPVPQPPRPEQDKIAAVLWKVQKAVEVQDKLVRTTRELKAAAMCRLFTHGVRNEPLKESEIGAVPESWGVQPFKELREFLQYGTSAKCDYGGRGRPVIRIPNIAGGEVRAQDIKWCDLSAAEIEALQLAEGDVLFVRTNGVRERVGTTAVYKGQPKDALFASYLIRARLKAKELVPEFYQYYTMTATGISLLSGRSSPAADGKFNINTKTIDSVVVPVPNPDEQRDIVHVLQIVDRKIALHEKKRTTLQDLFQTLLHQLMTARIRVHDLDIDTSEIAG